MKRFLIILFALITLSSCINNDKQYFQASPMLKIIATDPNGRPLIGANVILYDNEADYLEMRRPIRQGWTNVDGEIIFDRLYEQIYFFDVFDESLKVDNSRGVFFTRYPLIPNEILVVPVRTEYYR